VNPQLEGGRSDKITKDWFFIYSEGLFRDYFLYSGLDYWYPGKADYPLVIDLYQVWVDVFTYSKDRELKILGRLCYNYWVDQHTYWGGCIRKIKNLQDLVTYMEDVQYLYSCRFCIENVMPYVEEAESNCKWTIKRENYAGKKWWYHLKEAKYIY